MSGAPGILAQKEKLQGITADDLPWFFENIKRFETIHVPDVMQLPAGAAAEKEEFMRGGYSIPRHRPCHIE